MPVDLSRLIVRTYLIQVEIIKTGAVVERRIRALNARSAIRLLHKRTGPQGFKLGFLKVKSVTAAGAC